MVNLPNETRQRRAVDAFEQATQFGPADPGSPPQVVAQIIYGYLHAGSIENATNSATK